MQSQQWRLAVDGITYMTSKPSTKIDETREEQGITGNGLEVQH
ncbi:hypothetical protein OR222_04740 [Wolbachia endosymbiont of Drosophila pseudotakahashii]|nr:hypothetical protein [Wolbachia endosymbiont of Drosophila pseudotakahashii]